MSTADLKRSDLEQDEPIAEKVRRQLSGLTVWSHRSDIDCIDGLTRAIQAPGADRAAFSEALLDLLTDPDPALRTGAVKAIGESAGLFDAEVLAGVIVSNTARLDGVAPEGHRLDHPDLLGALLVAVGSTVCPDHPRALSLLRRAAADGRRWVLPALARADAEWLCRHPEVVPERSIGGVLRRLPSHDHRARFLTDARPFSDPTTLAGHRFWHMIPGDTDALKAIITAG